MHLYFHTNTEMALYYIKALLRDGDEHPMSEIYDYVMENCKGHAVMGEPMRATVISSALWRLANTDGSGYCRLRRGVYQMGDPKKTMRETPSLYERAIRIVSRAERELAASTPGITTAPTPAAGRASSSSSRSWSKASSL